MISAEEIEKLRKRAPRQAELLEAVAQADRADSRPPISCAKLRSIIRPCARWRSADSSSCAKKPCSAIHTRTSNSSRRPNLVLNAEQTAALSAVEEALAAPENAKPILLHGVTGSGKTEIYLQAIRSALARGKTAIVLVPEISLTPQTVERFKSRFAEAAGHGRGLAQPFSEGERHDEWHKIQSGRARIVIGARSAVFAPLENLGLIVVDEEHETSYKQEEAPRYHARDVAVVRGEDGEVRRACSGRATPSLESYSQRDPRQVSAAAT